MTRACAIAIDSGELSFGGGLLALLRPALATLAPGGVLALTSSSRTAREDLPSWCRIEHHDYVGCEPLGDGRDRHLIARGSFGVPRVLDEEPPARADRKTGFAPRGARVELGGPAYPYTLTELAGLAPVEAGELYRQAVLAQWDGAHDIPWDKIRPLSPALECAVAQVMTFLAENELSALYLPSKFVARLHPAYIEVAQFLASQLGDEARHVDVFLRRARAGGATLGLSTVTTSRSLLSLLELEDFTEASFLLSVLGEGTFLDLLRYVERHAPDEATAELARRARVDEARHVHFGIAHVRHALAVDRALSRRLADAVRRRVATLHGAGGVPAPIQDALTILAARGTDPKSVARGHASFRELVDEMRDGRAKRLEHAGFTAAESELLAELHTPNFM